MTRSRDIAEILGLTEAENTDNLSLGAGGGGGSGVTSYAYDSAGALLAADSSGYEDGSLHYLSKLREMYVWDDSDGGFFKVDALSENKLIQAPSMGNRTNAQGVVSGYTAGGWGPQMKNNIDKYSFTSDGNATDVGDLVTATYSGGGHSSSTHGYVTHGFTTPSQMNTNGMERFSLTVDGNSLALTAQLNPEQYYHGSVSSDDYGYAVGGTNPQAPFGSDRAYKFLFASDVNATGANYLLNSRTRSTGNNSTTHGYKSAGQGYGSSLAQVNQIEKFPFAANDDATDVGDITVSRINMGTAGSNSSTHGYLVGGNTNAGATYNIIDKFSFATDNNATDVGDLGYTTSGQANTSSTVNGYVAAGSEDNPGAPYTIATISKFPFASDAGSTSIGEVLVERYNVTPAQV